MAKGKIEARSAVKVRKRYVGEDLVTNVLYDGHHKGHGSKYMSGTVNGELVVDKNGKPLPLKHIGILK